MCSDGGHSQGGTDVCEGEGKGDACGDSLFGGGEENDNNILDARENANPDLCS